ncbi:MAG: MBL fold metallo-hydrolase [Gammaproteobacteria bacterium]|nr:MBL fold metallo-hydrolase [Gammaproteobacteria bacterium]
MNAVKTTFMIMTIGLLLSCAVNPYYNPTLAHHTKSGFKNIQHEDENGLFAFLQWRWQRLFKNIPGVEDYHFETDKTQHEFLKHNREKPSLTWIGHATFLIQFGGLNILTDPQFSERASPVSWAGPQRVIAPAITIEELPEIDAIIISHDHYDSLDLPSIQALAKHNQSRPLTIMIPLGIKPLLDELPLESTRVVELDWTQSHQVKAVSFSAEPIQHWGKRSLFDTNRRLWASWVIELQGKRIYFAGDSGYTKHFKEIGDKYGPFDLALLPIGAYAPRWFMSGNHVDPEEAVKIHRDLRSKYSVAMHWGTFILTDEPLDEPPLKLTEALNKHQIDATSFAVYQHGETQFLDELSTSPALMPAPVQ